MPGSSPRTDCSIRAHFRRHLSTGRSRAAHVAASVRPSHTRHSARDFRKRDCWCVNRESVCWDVKEPLLLPVPDSACAGRACPGRRSGDSGIRGGRHFNSCTASFPPWGEPGGHPVEKDKKEGCAEKPIFVYQRSACRHVTPIPYHATPSARVGRRIVRDEHPSAGVRTPPRPPEGRLRCVPRVRPVRSG